MNPIPNNILIWITFKVHSLLWNFTLTILIGKLQCQVCSQEVCSYLLHQEQELSDRGGNVDAEADCIMKTREKKSFKYIYAYIFRFSFAADLF